MADPAKNDLIWQGLCEKVSRAALRRRLGSPNPNHFTSGVLYLKSETSLLGDQMCPNGVGRPRPQGGRCDADDGRDSFDFFSRDGWLGVTKHILYLTFLPQ